MKVKFANEWITGDTPREWPGDVRINGQKAVQPAQSLRAAQARAYDRGNVRTTITFNISREHDNVMACQFYMMEHYVTVMQLGRGRCQFVFVSDGGQQNYYLLNAVITIPQQYQAGVRSFHSYVIEGGLPSRKPT